MRTTLKLVVLFFIITLNSWANSTPFSWYTPGNGGAVTINVALFLSSTCPYCHKEDAFFRELEEKNSWLHVQRHIIDKDKDSLALFNQLLLEQNADDFSVPSVFFCNSRWVGFYLPKTTGTELFKALKYCKRQIEVDGQLSQGTVNLMRQLGYINFFNTEAKSGWSVIGYLWGIGLLDSFSPCALFCFAGFCALLFIQDDRKKQVFSGLAYIVAIGGIHYAQQVYSSVFFELLPWLRVPAILIGLYGVYLAVQCYRKKEIYPSILVFSLLFALMLKSYQQACVLNVSLVFEQWLYHQYNSIIQTSLLQCAYQCIYLLPLILSLAFYLMFVKTSYYSRFKLRLKMLGIVFILLMSLILLVYPLILSSMALSIILILGLTVCSWIWCKYYP